jgi:hypothetical protein
MNFGHPVNGGTTVIDGNSIPIDGSPAPDSVAVPQTPEQNQAMLKSVWSSVDGALNTVPWYFTLAGGIALGMYLSKKLR